MGGFFGAALSFWEVSMAKSKQENLRTTTFPCFCGEMAEITVRTDDLLNGVSLTVKCKCKVAWNIRVREHAGYYREVRYG